MARPGTEAQGERTSERAGNGLWLGRLEQGSVCCPIDGALLLDRVLPEAFSVTDRCSVYCPRNGGVTQ